MTIHSITEGSFGLPNVKGPAFVYHKIDDSYSTAGDKIMWDIEIFIREVNFLSVSNPRALVTIIAFVSALNDGFVFYVCTKTAHQLVF